LKTLVHSALIQLKALDRTDRVHLEFPVQTADIKDQLEKGSAEFWQVRFESETVTTVVQLQIEQPIEIIPVGGGCEKPSEGSQSEPDYYTICHTLMKQD